VAFSSEPTLLVPTTDDVENVEDSLEELVSHGATSLHDAVVTSLYYFRGVRGRRAMVLLSDGDDTTSAMPFRDALEYARRSGVTIYTIGLDVGMLEKGVRGKLTDLSKETGGRTFFISQAAELISVYKEIEEELRSQYLVAYSSDQPGQEGVFRQVEVKVRGGKLKARTISGYYP
jgi:Ca-activated chloride channel family protein